MVSNLSALHRSVVSWWDTDALKVSFLTTFFEKLQSLSKLLCDAQSAPAGPGKVKKPWMLTFNRGHHVSAFFLQMLFSVGRYCCQCVCQMQLLYVKCSCFCMTLREKTRCILHHCIPPASLSYARGQHGLLGAQVILSVRIAQNRIMMWDSRKEP